MDIQEFYQRINLNTELKNISEKICNKYNLGEYISDYIIEIGYEDFNYILTTSKNKYFIKILYSGRDYNEAKDYEERIKKVSETNINFPKVLTAEGEILYKLKIDSVEYRIMVFEYVDSQNLFVMGITLAENELVEIAKQIKMIHSIDLKPKFIYDSWAINNFLPEFEKKKQFLPKEYINKIEDIYNEYKSIDIKKLPHNFVHGDIMNTNVMKDKNNKLWIIDFAVSNYLPRITDLAVSACNLCVVEESKGKTYKRIEILLKEYIKGNEFTEDEKQNFKLFFEISNAMFILQSSYQKSIGNNSDENKYWFNKGTIGLNFSDTKEFNKILKRKEVKK